MYHVTVLCFQDHEVKTHQGNLYKGKRFTGKVCLFFDGLGLLVTGCFWC